MKILAIETSCDETAIAIIEMTGTKQKPVLHVRVNLVSSQIALHAPFGGVVPNLAKREHQKQLVPLLIRALTQSGLLKKTRKGLPYNKETLMRIFEREPELHGQVLKRVISLAPPDIDVIAVTHGPGLNPALWVGVNFAKALSLLWDKPIIPSNHMEGHFFSAFLKREPKNDSYTLASVQFPILGLLVSGGHTELVLSPQLGSYELLGQTLDDAAGEAFDKVARILGLSYPGGPAISAAAGEPTEYVLPSSLPRPLLHTKNYDFSFSGLKTAVLYMVRDEIKIHSVERIRPAVAKEFQDAVVDVLIAKTIAAVRAHRAKTVALGGGVAANNLLRSRLSAAMQEEFPSVILQLPPPAATGDNALMIALAAFFSPIKSAWNSVQAHPNLRIDGSEN